MWIAIFPLHILIDSSGLGCINRRLKSQMSRWCYPLQRIQQLNGILFWGFLEKKKRKNLIEKKIYQ